MIEWRVDHGGLSCILYHVPFDKFYTIGIDHLYGTYLYGIPIRLLVNRTCYIFSWINGVAQECIRWDTHQEGMAVNRVSHSA